MYYVHAFSEQWNLYLTSNSYGLCVVSVSRANTNSDNLWLFSVTTLEEEFCQVKRKILSQNSLYTQCPVCFYYCLSKCVYLSPCVDERVGFIITSWHSSSCGAVQKFGPWSVLCRSVKESHYDWNSIGLLLYLQYL